jgi:predicted dehydrogenase
MINVAVVGYGYWGPNLVRNFQEIDGCRVAVCCDSDSVRLASIKSKHPTVDATNDYSSVLKDKNIAAVIIATPIGTHYRLARQALENGKHVLVEKPLAATVSEAECLVEIAERSGLTLMVDHTFVYTGAVRKIKQIIDQGEIGDLYYFDSVRINLGLIQRDVNVLWDLAPHDVAILGYLISETPVAVCANGASHFGNGIENVAYLSVYFSSGFIAHFHNNWLAPVKIRTVILGGSRKMILYDDMDASEKVKVYDRGVDVSKPENRRDALIDYRLGDMWAPRLDTTEALYLVAAEFVNCIVAKRRPTTDGISGLNVVRILEASEMSIKRRGREVKL